MACFHAWEAAVRILARRGALAGVGCSLLTAGMGMGEGARSPCSRAMISGLATTSIRVAQEPRPPLLRRPPSPNRHRGRNGFRQAVEHLVQAVQFLRQRSTGFASTVKRSS